jgi:DNA repair photolyase
VTIVVKFEEMKSKTILTKHKYRDNWFWCRYSINPYRGCQFACNYCDAITEKYLVHEKAEDFSRIIYCKTDAPELLKKEIKKAKPDVVALSGVTDPYQPAEKKYEITRKVLEILNDNKFPVSIGTKSDLILRDVDLLSKISKNSWCAVSFTITTFNKKLLSLLEPFAPSPERRLEAVKGLNEAGVQAGVNFTPIIPYLLDDDWNIADVIEKASRAGAKYILHGAGMSLRSNQKVRFLKLLEENWPELLVNFQDLYSTSESPSQGYAVNINRKAFELRKKLGIPDYIAPPSFERPLKENFGVAGVLLLIAYFKEMRAGNPYAAWAYHKAVEKIEKLTESIRSVHARDELKLIPGVGESLAKTVDELLRTEKSEKLEKLKNKW